MGFFKKQAPDTAEIARLKAEIAAMGARLDASDASKHELGTRVQGLVTRLDTPIAPPPSGPPPARPASVSPAELDVVRAQIQRLNDRLDTIDTRVTSISTELANQLSELSGDIDAMGDGQPPTEQAVGQIRDAQTRLANEQARYQIAFRQDLADLADRLVSDTKRSPPRS